MSGSRGATTVSDRTFVKIVEQVVAEDGRLADRPHARAVVSGSAAAVHLDVAMPYPASVPYLAAGIRERVRDRVPALTGIAVENVDIEIVRLVPVSDQAKSAESPAKRTTGPPPDRSQPQERS